MFISMQIRIQVNLSKRFFHFQLQRVIQLITISRKQTIYLAPDYNTNPERTPKPLDNRIESGHCNLIRALN